MRFLSSCQGSGTMLTTFHECSHLILIKALMGRFIWMGHSLHRKAGNQTQEPSGSKGDWAVGAPVPQCHYDRHGLYPPRLLSQTHHPTTTPPT